MPSKSKATTDPLIIISLTDGLADRHRLPLAHVMKVLKEVESMINDLGSRILKERGMPDSKPDFGIELVAENGIAFRKGSVRATIAITRHVEVGMLAAGELIGTTSALSLKKRGPAIALEPSRELSARVVAGLDRIAYVSQAAKTNTRFEVKAPMALIAAADMKPLTMRRAVLGNTATENLRSLRAPAFEESNVRLYGKLFRLKDTPLTTADAVNKFWGELHKDNGERWRIEFKGKDLERVTPLFTHQVLATGNAVYYRGASPKLKADEIDLDTDRDLVAAYGELFGVDRDPSLPGDPRAM